MNDDVVAVEMLPESEWSYPSAVILREEEEKADEEVDNEVVI